MKFKVIQLAGFFVLVFIFGCTRCSKQQEAKPLKQLNPNEIIVGTFNIEWLGDGYNDRIERNEKDYQNIARIIEESQCDIVGVQEIENFNALAKLIRYLPEYSFYITKDDAPQKVGLIFHKSLKVKYISDYLPLEVEERKTRPGLIAAIEKGNFDFLTLVVHFKATSRFDDTKEKVEQSRILRMKQAQVVSDWVDSILSQKDEEDLFIIGDFNDSPIRKQFNTLIPLLSNNNLIFLTEQLKSCKFPNAYVIDHILITKQSLKRYINNSLSMYNTFRIYPQELAQKISDHCLVYARFDVTQPDNDPSDYFGRKKISIKN